MEKQRIVWIDTAKGICIILVVLYHSLIHTHADFLLSNTNVENFLSAFRMPLYFALSGIFSRHIVLSVILSLEKLINLLFLFCFSIYWVR